MIAGGASGYGSAITVAVSVADYFLPAWMTRRFGGSRSGAIGATVGVFAGFFFFPPVGIILGPFFGAVLGRAAQRPPRRGARRFWSAYGSFLSFVVGTGIKLAAAVGHARSMSTADTYPAAPGLVRNSFLTLSHNEKVSTICGSHRSDAGRGLFQVQVRNGGGRSVEHPHLHARQRTESLHERKQGGAPHPDLYRREGRRQERPRGDHGSGALLRTPDVQRHRSSSALRTTPRRNRCSTRSKISSRFTARPPTRPNAPPSTAASTRSATKLRKSPFPTSTTS